ncbi:Gamma-aminobutyric acid type B receptor subunit 2 [Bulinus truncatus]|nr:Gamma-aminobutyric acid type B receptor subunit 2 [Bulinus truncatus]
MDVLLQTGKTAGHYINGAEVSYAETSPALREREKYRTFFSLALGDSALNPARRMLVQNFKWDKVAALYEDHESLSLAFNDINKDFSAHDIVIKSSTSFKDVKMEVPGKLKEMMDLDVRIILAGFKESTARQVFCQAFKLGMHSPRYVWILVGLLKSTWWTEVKDTTCSVQEMATAVEGAFIIFSLNGLLDGGKSVANLTSSEFTEAYINANGSLPMSIFAGSTYDTIWTMALTLRQATALWSENGTAPLLHRLSYDDMADVKETFITTMENLEFPGVSGPVSFKGSDREGITAVYQIQAGNFTQVAIHQPGSGHLDFTCDSCHKIYWKDERVPKDEQVVLARPKTIDKFVFYTSSGLCVMGVVIAVCFLSYNLYHRRLKYIKLSSPMLNNVAVVGCILVYLAVIMLGLDDRTLSEEVFPIICTVRAFLLAAGFSLAFGAMFAKTFRVHQIFTRAHHGLVKSKLIQDTHLLVIIGVLLAVDSSLVLVWVLVDPMSRLVYNTTTEVSAEDEDLIFQEQLTTCHSSHLQKWLGAFYAYKGLLLIFGVYMAWETRRVKIPALNDSKYIGLNVYNVVIMSVSVVVISNILSSQPTLAYAMEASFMFLSTTVTLCLLFVPKIYALVTSGGNPVIACTGILVDNSNTRRFVFDDRKEIYYRAEVQNRVYKREIVELDQKIARLETLLELPYEPYPTLIDELMYYLPESKSSGQSRCYRRYKKELERCNSISDGDGVVYDSSENDDILTEMGYPSTLKPAPSSKKSGQAGEANRRGSKTFQKLTRSWSIGAGSRIRRKRKSLETSSTFLPFSSSESNFMNSKDHQNSHFASGANVPNCSDDMTYLRTDTGISLLVDGRCSRGDSSVPMLNKITQTSSGKEVFTKRLASFKSNKQSRECLSREGDDSDKRGRPKKGLLSSTGSTRQGRLFSVHQLRIEMVEEDSTSNNEDTESLAGSSTGCMSPSNELSSARSNQVLASTTGSQQKTFSQNNPVTWFGELKSPSACPAITMYLTPYEHSKDGPENVRRLSAPSPSIHRAEAPLPFVSPSAISLTATVHPPKTSTSPLCLSSFVQHSKENQELSKSDICLSCPSRESVSSEASPLRSPVRNPPPLYAKGNSSDSKGLLHMNSLSALIASTHSLCSSESFSTTPPPSPLSSSAQRASQTNHIQKVSVSIESPSESVPHYSSFRNIQSLPSSEQSYWLSSANEVSSDQQEPDTEKGVSRKATAEKNRRQRIRQLQADLVKIQKELHELTNVETSEV